MNCIGSKLKLIDFIKNTIIKYCGEQLNDMIFCDAFAGTGVVGKNMAPFVKYVISNDVEFYSYISSYVTLNGYDENNVSLILNTINNINGDYNGEIAQKYSEGGNAHRLFYSKENGAKLSAARTYIENLYLCEKINVNDYYALILSIINASEAVANTTGVYGAFLKKLKPSALKPIQFKLPETLPSDFNKNHVVLQDNANDVIKKIKGDILYLDPPYNTRQYSSNYHILNYIAKNIYPETSSVSDVKDGYKSHYSSKKDAANELEDLIKNANFEWIFMSYNNEGIIPLDEIKRIFSIYGDYSIEMKEHQRYKADNNRRNLAGSDKTIEYIHILHKKKFIPIKNKEIIIQNNLITSPMNYMGGKKRLFPIISQYFPNKINKFIDLFCGGCTVGINVNANEIIFNDSLKPLITLYQYFSTHNSDDIINYIESTIQLKHINNTNVDAYNDFKKNYNADEFANPLDLFILIAFAFNNQVRFNNKNEFNIPLGVNRTGWNPRMKKNLISFINALNQKNVSFEYNDFRNFNYDKLNENDFVYLDPPYLISQATYNNVWNENTEKDLFNIILSLHERNIKFALSNVLENKGMKNDLLKNWALNNNFKIIHLEQNYSHSAYCRKQKDSKTDEVLIINY